MEASVSWETSNDENKSTEIGLHNDLFLKESSFAISYMHILVLAHYHCKITTSVIRNLVQNLIYIRRIDISGLLDT